MENKKVDEILEGLGGDIQVGKRYYIFAVPFHYIGTVAKITAETIILDENDNYIVMNAGGEEDAVSQIVAGKKKPQIWEKCPGRILIFKGSISTIISMKK